MGKVALCFFGRVGKRYEYPLLAQSVVMVLAMIALMHLCVKVEREVSPGVARRISGKGPYPIAY